MAEIKNSINDTIIPGTPNDDSITNFGYNVTINAGAGNDSIYNYLGSNEILDAGDGNDLIVSTGNNMTINPGNGNDTIELYAYANYVDNIQYESGNDVIQNYRAEDKIKLLSGNISKAELDGNDVVITIGNGSITLKDTKDKEVNILDSNNKTIKFTNTYQGNSVSNNVINNSANNTLISGTNGNDSIINSGSYVTVNTGAGNDTLSMIVNNSKNNYYLTLSDFGKDDVLDISDSISGFRVANVTTVGFRLLSSYYLDPNLIIDFPNIKNDKDIEELKKVRVKNGNTLTTIGELLKDIVSIDDNATIYGTNDDDIFIEVNGKNALVYGYDGNDEIHFNNTNIGKSIVYAGKGNDVITNPYIDPRYAQDNGLRNGDGSKFYGGEDDDAFYLGNLKNATLNGDSGKDQLLIYCSDNVVINGGDSDDYIRGVAVKNATLDGGDGNDNILATGNSENVTIIVGKGNDNINLYATESVIQYATGDGNDVVEIIALKIKSNYSLAKSVKLNSMATML